MSETIFTKSVHAGEEPEKHNGAVSTPVFRSSLFRFEDADEGAAIHNFEKPGYFYSRLGNPTQRALEKAVAELEFGEDAVAVGSGMAAISGAVLAFCKTGDHVIALDSMYSTSSGMFDYFTEKFGIEVSRVRGDIAESYKDAVRENTRLLWVETPSNPVLNITDLSSVADFARENGLLTIADNTFATPFNQNPIKHGIDISIHSATKYLGGHSDVTAGVIVSDKEKIETINHTAVEYLGASIAPDVAWLTLRGIKTLALRMERHNQNAQELAGFLNDDERVSKVYYPGLPNHQMHSVAKDQMRGFGGMISFDLGEFHRAKAFMNRIKLISLATSLGGVESIAQHSASMTHAKLAPEERKAAGISEGLIRFSVGIEDVEDLKRDLDHALGTT